MTEERKKRKKKKKKKKRKRKRKRGLKWQPSQGQWARVHRELDSLVGDFNAFRRLVDHAAEEVFVLHFCEEEEVQKRTLMSTHSAQKKKKSRTKPL